MPSAHAVLSAAGLLIAAAAPAALSAAPALSDVQPGSRRLPTLELANRYSAVRETGRITGTVVNPFSPPSFDAPDPEEMRLAAEAAEAARRAGLAVKPTNTRDLLVSLANQLKVSGAAVLGGEPILLVGTRKMRIGESLNAEYEGKTISVTITAITSSNFTLRLNGEEYTRPTKLGK